MTAELDLADLHDDLRAVARDVLVPHAGRDTADPDAWARFASMGWLGLEVPEALDGGGATFAELAVILEELGRAAVCSPYLGTVVLGVGTLNLVEPAGGSRALLREAGAGRSRVAVVLATGDDAVDDVPTNFRLERGPGGLRLHGSATSVPDVAGADHLLVLAVDGPSQPVVVCLDPRGPGLDVAPRPVVDGTRRLDDVRADGVAVTADGVLRFTGTPEDGARELADRAALAIAWDSLGIAEAMLSATVAYAGVREQFGRPIGSFQAVKHACADMLVAISVSRELLLDATREVAGRGAGRAASVAMAKAFVCDAAVDVAGAAMQLHGGIGYSWESGVHRYLKRALLNRSLFGSPTAHRRRLARRYFTAGGATCGSA